VLCAVSNNVSRYKSSKYLLKGHLIQVQKNTLKVLWFNILNCDRIASLLKKNKLTSNVVYFTRYYLTGLGFKCFCFKTILYLLLGFSHYILIPIPAMIRIYCFKKRLYIFSKSRLVLSMFIGLIKKCKSLNVFKHKGLFQ